MLLRRSAVDDAGFPARTVPPRAGDVRRAGARRQVYVGLVPAQVTGGGVRVGHVVPDIAVGKPAGRLPANGAVQGLAVVHRNVEIDSRNVATLVQRVPFSFVRVLRNADVHLDILNSGGWRNPQRRESRLCRRIGEESGGAGNVTGNKPSLAVLGVEPPDIVRRLIVRPPPRLTVAKPGCRDERLVLRIVSP